MYFFLFSLNKSLSQEQTLRQQFTSTLDDFEHKLQEKDSQIIQAQKTYDELVVKHNNLIREKRSLTQQLQDTISQSQQDKKRAEK